MFPHNFSNLNLWFVQGKIKHTPIGLSVKLDSDNLPHSLLFRGKSIYTSTKADKDRILRQNEKDKSKLLSKVLHRSLRSSLSQDVIKMWIESPYTKPEIASSLKNLNYFSEKIIPMCWWGNFLDAGGYGNMNRSFLFRLHNYHILAKADIIPTINQISATGQYYVHKHASLNYRRLNKCVKVCSFGPHAQTRQNASVVFFTMMETETLHPSFRDMCNGYCDEIWVPSSHNKNLFISGGVKKPILVMPLGMDEVVYRNIESIKSKNLSDMPVCDILGKPASRGINTFRFFTLLGWSYRKGTDILIKSFVKAFSAKDDVSLIIYSNHVGPDPVKRESSEYAKSIRNSDYPQILFIPGVTPEKEMPSLYKMGHAFIHTSRGEGFSLAQIEASVCGLPVISCNNTGMSEYLRDDNSFLIKTNDVEMADGRITWISPFYHGQMFPKLGENQIDQAVEHMKYVIGHYDRAVEKNKILQNEIFQKYTWEKAAERVSYRIKQIA